MKKIGCVQHDCEHCKAQAAEIERLTLRLKMTSDTMNGYMLERDQLKAKLDAAQAQEPVAWRYQDARGNYRYRAYVPKFDVEYKLLKPVPLYASPVVQQAQEPVTRGDAEPLFRAAINCPHEIDSQQVILKYDPKQAGHNALNQLHLRLVAASPTPRQPSPVVQQAWQPIETAPKDGRNLILLLTPSGFPQVAYSNTWWTAGFSAECKPTHWMPLPAAPAIGGQP